MKVLKSCILLLFWPYITMAQVVRLTNDETCAIKISVIDTVTDCFYVNKIRPRYHLRILKIRVDSVLYRGGPCFCCHRSERDLVLHSEYGKLSERPYMLQEVSYLVIPCGAVVESHILIRPGYGNTCIPYLRFSRNIPANATTFSYRRTYGRYHAIHNSNREFALYPLIDRMMNPYHNWLGRRVITKLENGSLSWEKLEHYWDTKYNNLFYYPFLVTVTDEIPSLISIYEPNPPARDQGYYNQKSKHGGYVLGIPITPPYPQIRAFQKLYASLRQIDKLSFDQPPRKRTWWFRGGGWGM